MIERISPAPGCHRVKAGLHPRTGFMIIFPLVVMICLFTLYLVSSNLQESNALWGLGLMMAILCSTALYLRWEDLGEAVAWDELAVYVRQNHPEWGRWGNKSFLRVPYKNIASIEPRASPRGVPPLYPVLEIVVRDEAQSPGTRIMIDPNYFRISSLLDFVSELRRQAPQIDGGGNARRLDKIVERIHRNRMPWD